MVKSRLPLPSWLHKLRLRVWEQLEDLFEASRAAVACVGDRVPVPPSLW